MPGRQAKIITPRCCAACSAPSPAVKRPAATASSSCCRQGRPARLRDRPARLVDGSRRARAGRRYPGRLRRDRQKARRSTHPDASQPRAGAGRPQTRLGAGGAGGSLGARRVHAADQHRQLVRRLFAGLELEAVRRIPAVAASLRRRRETRTRRLQLRDVQLLAGHKSIEITQGYIDGETGGQRRLVASL